MTIVEAIEFVLGTAPEGLTAKEIYDEIIKRKLYSFGAKTRWGLSIAKYAEDVSGWIFPLHTLLRYSEL